MKTVEEMKDFRGTKGKWDAQLVSTGNGSFYRVGIFDGESVCNITTRNSDRALANTCLIAAAPELLGALLRLTNICSQEAITDRDSFYKEFDEAVSEAKKTINKALGEEQE